MCVSNILHELVPSYQGDLSILPMLKSLDYGKVTYIASSPNGQWLVKA
jgi:hypothetical protein